ncbi:MAG: hypothetical protein COU29_00700 [Candidatus Magasanikbacteria bacterium CG10_big_fil_rev_8_21_14_0_10_36_32]|uniref:Uncharacterized protein n=1 Tax=Candidatus Magasanikbacteria bacterium CG10_big_fil_rev_8_21_14_0_10_36_32 TaxID=1974646 RepID=A0A2M6W668_9BACT|nr:MAG: hypothetical protein COU29_00700 [Candidatus Magasanikbacteria bacterium CG10_big_fil_rev_8_21_14_0_10_36_32]
MSIFHLFELSYWFQQPFIARQWSLRGWVIILLILVFVGIVGKIWQLKQSEKVVRQIFNRLSNISLIVGLLGLLWLFFRQQQVPFFAWRFWLVLLFGGLLWSIVRTIIFLVRRYPEIKVEKAEKALKDRYLPKK